jgi:hypothetical protein
VFCGQTLLDRRMRSNRMVGPGNKHELAFPCGFETDGELQRHFQRQMIGHDGKANVNARPVRRMARAIEGHWSPHSTVPKVSIMHGLRVEAESGLDFSVAMGSARSLMFRVDLDRHHDEI